MTKKHEHKTKWVGTFDELPGGRLHKGDHVREYMSKLRTKFTGPVGVILYFAQAKVKSKGMVWRALVGWKPEDAEHYDQFVDADLLGVVVGSDPTYSEPIEDKDTTVCDCGGELKFDPDLVGDTCGGLTLRGWMVCQKCGKGCLAPKGMAVVYEGKWKLASGGRSVETGNGRIRVDGATDAEKLMARILKLPDLELEVAQLRKYRDEQEALVKESETVPPLDPEFAPVTPRGEPSPWHECKLVVNGIKLEDGDRVLLINQPEPIGNGVRIIRLEKP